MKRKFENQRLFHYSIRKTSLGVGSVIVGLFLLSAGLSDQLVLAEEVDSLELVDTSTTISEVAGNAENERANDSESTHLVATENVEIPEETEFLSTNLQIDSEHPSENATDTAINAAPRMTDGSMENSSMTDAAALDETVTVLNVLDYGADASGQSDSTEAVKAAILAAKQLTGKKTILFPKGDYHFYPEKAETKELYISNTVGDDQNYKDKSIGFYFDSVNDVTIDGSGSTFLFHGKMMPLTAINSKNITFKNFNLDVKVPTVVDLYVEAVDGKIATYYVPEEYNYTIKDKKVVWSGDTSPYTGQPYWVTENKMNYSQTHDVKTGLTWRGPNKVFDDIQSIEDLGNRRFKIHYTRQHDSIQQGLSFQMRPTVRDHAGGFFMNSENVTFDHLNIHFIHGFGFVVQTCKDFTMTNTHFKTPETSMRTTAGYADFLQVSGSRGEVRIEHSSFENPHDDPINIHGTFLQVKERLSARQFKVRYMHHETAGFPTFFVGDTVEFVRKDNLITETGSLAKVVAVDGPDGRSNKGNLREIIVTLDRDMPDVVGVDSHVLENITYTPKVTIRNNHFKSTPTRGILVTTRQPVLIENNVFEGMGMASIFISNDANNWYESGAVKDVTIRNNTFYANGRTTKDAIIFINPINHRVSETATVHENIKIENNQFYVLDTAVVDAKSVERLVLKDNRIDRLVADMMIHLRSPKTHLKLGEQLQLEVDHHSSRLNKDLFVLNGVRNAHFINNHIDGGLDANIRTSNQSSLTQEGGTVLTVDGSRKALPLVEKVGYTVSDSSIAKVNQRGVIEGLSSGTVLVRGYVEVNNKRYYSQPLEVTVTNERVEEASTLTIETANQQPLLQTTQLNLSHPVDGVTWSLEGEGAETFARLDSQTGVLTPLKHGLVTVRAISSNGQTARKSFVVGEVPPRVAAHLTVVRPSGSGIYPENDGMTIVAQSGSLWATGISKDIVLAPITTSEHLTVSLKVSGKTKASYDEAGLIVYKDDNNYVILNRKHANGSPKIHLVFEKNGRPDESHHVADIESEAVYYKLEKAGNRVTGYYSTDQVNWLKITEVDLPELGNDFKVGLIAAGGTDTRTPFHFSDLKVNGEAIALTHKPAAPIAEMITLSLGDQAVMTSLDQSELPKYVIKWQVATSEDGRYKELAGTSTTLALDSSLQGHYVKALLIPVENGVYGQPRETAPLFIKTVSGVEIQDKEKAEAWTSLSSVRINQEEISLAKGSFGSLFSLPAGATSLDAVFVARAKEAKIEVFFNGEKVESGIGSVSVSNIERQAGRNIFDVKVTAPDGQQVQYYRYAHVYPVVSEAGLAEILVNGQPLKDFSEEEKTYLLDVDTDSIQLDARAKEAGNLLYVTTASGRKAFKAGGYPIAPGVNLLTITAVSSTGAHVEHYNLYIRRAHPEATGLWQANFGEMAHLDKPFSKNEQTYRVVATTPNVPVYLVAENPTALVTVDYLGREYSGKGALEGILPVYKEAQDVRVRVQTESGERTYRIHLQGQDYVEASDLVLSPESRTGWGSIQRNKSVAGNPLRLKIGEEIRTFDTGIGFHADGQLVYDIADKGYTRFTGYIGLDAAVKKHGDMVFKILIDGKEVRTFPTVSSQQNQAHAFDIDVRNARQVVIRAEKVQYDWSDHANLGGARFWLDLPTSPEKSETGEPAIIFQPEIVVINEEVDYTTETRENPNLEKGQKRLIRPGKNGLRRMIKKVVKDEEDRLVSEEILSTEMIQPVVTEILEIGTGILKSEIGEALIIDEKPSYTLEREEVGHALILDEKPAYVLERKEVGEALILDAKPAYSFETQDIVYIQGREPVMMKRLAVADSVKGESLYSRSAKATTSSGFENKVEKAVESQRVPSKKEGENLPETGERGSSLLILAGLGLGLCLLARAKGENRSMFDRDKAI